MWHRMDVKDIYTKLSTSDQGLTDNEAEKRLQQYGYNELKEKKKITGLQLFINQFKNFLIFILIIAMIVSLFLGELIDAVAIFTILVLNAFFGFYQERKAEHALEALKKIAAPKAKIIRAGQTRFVLARELVPGDIILLETGDKVPADARIVEELNLKIDESVLTGESVAVKKTAVKVSKDAIPDRKNIAFSGTTVVYGHCKAVVIATAMETEFGKIAKILQEAEEMTPLQKRLESLGKQLGIVILAITAIVFLAGYFHGIELVEMFLVAVSLAVAAIPEGLPAVVTITLSIGLLRMAKKNAIIRKLSAAEALGSTTVICTDKTGTLTVNQMTVRKLYVNNEIIEVTGEGYETIGKFLFDKKEIMDEGIKTLLKIGNLCNNATLDKEAVGDPTEIALLVSAHKAGFSDLRKKYRKIDEIPFESERKMMSALFEDDGREGKVIYTKGAAEEVLKRCEFIYKNGKKERLTTKDRKEIMEMNSKFALSSLRVLAFAMKELGKFEENDLMFVGLQAMIDPPRPEVKDAVKKCKDAGIKVVMTTGDHKDTAVTIAREIGILDKGGVLTGEELEKINEKEFLAIVDDVSVYARVSPEHKVKITSALKKKGHIVAMTGDGVNDAPALKKADVGIAMGITGTDVTKESSDMILTDDNFATIVAAVEEGRTIYDNIKKFVVYLLSANMGEIMTIFTAIMLNLPLPLLPLQILWMNLITDGLPALALGVEVPEPDIMKRKPRDPREKILNRSVLTYVILVGFIYVIGTLGLFYLELANETKARTMAFTVIIMFEMFHALAIRSYMPIYKIGFFSNKKLIIAIASSVVLQAMVIYVPFFNVIFDTVPLSAMDWVKIILVSSSIFFILEAHKLLKHKKKV